MPCPADHARSRQFEWEAAAPTVSTAVSDFTYVSTSGLHMVVYVANS